MPPPQKKKYCYALYSSESIAPISGLSNEILLILVAEGAAKM